VQQGLFFDFEFGFFGFVGSFTLGAGEDFLRLILGIFQSQAIKDFHEHNRQDEGDHRSDRSNDRRVGFGKKWCHGWLPAQAVRRARMLQATGDARSTKASPFFGRRNFNACREAS
jgi:hypothetical protein